MKRLRSTEYKLELVATHDLERVEAGDEADTWQMTGDDPQFVAALPVTLAPGSYRIRLVGFSGDEELRAPMLYFDQGDGFNQHDNVLLAFEQKGRFLEAVFELPAPAKFLRFDPSVAPGKFRLKDATIKRVSTTLHRTGIIVRTVGRHVNSPSDAVRLANRSVQVLRRDGVAGLRHAFRRAASQGASGYDEWVRRYDTFSAEELAAMTNIAQSLTFRPLISVLMPVYNSPIDLLTEAIESVRSQAYPNWQLCIADDKSTDRRISELLRRYEAIDDRIKVAYRESNGHISAASNSALELVEGDWIALLDHDDLLRPNALLEVACEIARNPDCGLIYSDEDKIDERRRRYDAFFKPDFSIELLRSQNYFNHLTVHRADLALNREGAGQTASVIFQSGYEGRAEFGLTGEDSFDLKVSADGQAWRTALAIDPETGAVDAPAGLRYPGYWRFFASTDLIVTGAPTAPLVFDTASHNPGLAYNPATGAFTAPEDGLYLVVLSFNTSGAAPFTVDAEINGTPTTRVQFSPNGFSHLSKTFTCAMTAGDQLTFLVKENSSARFDGGGLFDNVVILRLGLL